MFEGHDHGGGEREGSSDEDDEDIVVTGLSIFKEKADYNYQLAGTIVDEPPDQISIDEHKHLLNDRVHHLILEVLEEAQITFKLADFQLLSLHLLGSKRSVILISSTGSGKMLVIQLAPLLLRKVFEIPGGVGVGTQPLSIIMEEKMGNPVVPTAVVTMRGKIKLDVEDTGEASLSSSEASILRGDFPLLIGHAESWCNQVGQDLLRKLKQKGLVLFNYVDELHQGLEGHWNSIRPEMRNVTTRIRIFSQPDSPAIAISTTATEQEVASMAKSLGRREKPVVLRASPIQDHIKLAVVKRPSNSSGIDGGRVDKKGNVQPGLADLLNRIYLFEFYRDDFK